MGDGTVSVFTAGDIEGRLVCVCISGDGVDAAVMFVVWGVLPCIMDASPARPSKGFPFPSCEIPWLLIPEVDCSTKYMFAQSVCIMDGEGDGAACEGRRPKSS